MEKSSGETAECERCCKCNQKPEPISAVAMAAPAVRPLSRHQSKHLVQVASHITHSTMLQRSARRLVPVLSRRSTTLRYSSTTNDNPNPTNTAPRASPPTVSSTNALPSSAAGNKDAALVEDPAEGEAKRVMQAPNRATTWSRSQQPREKAMVGPRFEQTIMEDQV